MIKIDFTKEHREFYSASAAKASIVGVPALNYLMVLGSGDPNTSKRYKDAIEALYSLSYTLKFMVKKGPMEIDYKVMPLEGLWWTDGMIEINLEQKDDWKWIAMIMQPNLITGELLSEAKKQVSKKKDLQILSDVGLGEYEEGTSAQILHIGPYSEEQVTLQKLHDFIHDEGYVPSGKHHEIYLNNPEKTAPKNIKTILRQPIKKQAGS